MGMLLACIMHVKGVVPRAPPRPVPGGERAWCWRLRVGGSVAVGCSRRGDAEAAWDVVCGVGVVGCDFEPVWCSCWSSFAVCGLTGGWYRGCRQVVVRWRRRSRFRVCRSRRGGWLCRRRR